MSRRQKAMEDKHVDQSSKGPRIKDYRTWSNLEEIRKQVIWERMWTSNETKIRASLQAQYKNGAKLYDELLAIENSPLNKALE